MMKIRFFMISCLIILVTVVPLTTMNAYAGKKENQAAYVAGGAGVGLWLLFTILGDPEAGTEALEKTKETLENLQGDYVAGQETLPLTKHLNRLNAIEFVGPESHGLASQYDNSGVTYSLFEW